MVETDAVDAGIERVLVVTAHPDDVDFAAAGSVARWTDAGIEVVYCLVTSGEAGGSDRSISRADMAELRRREQTAAAKRVGVHELVFLGYADGRVVASVELRRDISRVIRRFRPDRVLSQSPERDLTRIYASHPDHLATGAATLDAVYPDARNPFAHPELLDEGLEPWAVPEVYLMTITGGDVVVDITDSMDRKVEALLSHESQIDDPDGRRDLLRQWAASIARGAGLGDGRFAESFRRVDTA
ncbi:MAG TPA: PIG-L deacetylase family protein [Acidimicrobiia bacterium]|nr:PIG-L deacetylase family protein [Acidimicrobiia bacterium]